MSYEQYKSDDPAYNFSKGPKSLYVPTGTSVTSILSGVVLNVPQTDTDDEWGGTERISMERLIDKTAVLEVAVEGVSGTGGLKNQMKTLIGTGTTPGSIPFFDYTKPSLTLKLLADAAGVTIDGALKTVTIGTAPTLTETSLTLGNDLSISTLTNYSSVKYRQAAFNLLDDNVLSPSATISLGTISPVIYSFGTTAFTVPAGVAATFNGDLSVAGTITGSMDSTSGTISTLYTGAILPKDGSGPYDIGQSGNRYGTVYATTFLGTSGNMSGSFTATSMQVSSGGFLSSAPGGVATLQSSSSFNITGADNSVISVTGGGALSMSAAGGLRFNSPAIFSGSVTFSSGVPSLTVTGALSADSVSTGIGTSNFGSVSINGGTGQVNASVLQTNNIVATNTGAFGNLAVNTNANINGILTVPNITAPTVAITATDTTGPGKLTLSAYTINIVTTAALPGWSAPTLSINAYATQFSGTVSASGDIVSSGDLISSGNISTVSTGDIYSRAWTTLTPTSIQGWASYTINNCYYKKIGKRAFVDIYISGPAHPSQVPAIQLPSSLTPKTATNYQAVFPVQLEDAGAFQTTPGIVMLFSNDGNLLITKNWAGGNSWTGSGNRTIIFNIQYELA
jgi:hypothetical protein